MSSSAIVVNKQEWKPSRSIKRSLSALAAGPTGAESSAAATKSRSEQQSGIKRPHRLLSINENKSLESNKKSRQTKKSSGSKKKSEQTTRSLSKRRKSEPQVRYATIAEKTAESRAANKEDENERNRLRADWVNQELEAWEAENKLALDELNMSRRRGEKVRKEVELNLQAEKEFPSPHALNYYKKNSGNNAGNNNNNNDENGSGDNATELGIQLRAKKVTRKASKEAAIAKQCNESIGAFNSKVNKCWLCGFCISGLTTRNRKGPDGKTVTKNLKDFSTLIDGMLYSDEMPKPPLEFPGMRNSYLSPKRKDILTQFIRENLLGSKCNGKRGPLYDEPVCEHVLPVILGFLFLDILQKDGGGGNETAIARVLEYLYAHNKCNYDKGGLNFVTLPKGWKNVYGSQVNTSKIKKQLDKVNKENGKSKIQLQWAAAGGNIEIMTYNNSTLAYIDILERFTIWYANKNGILYKPAFIELFKECVNSDIWERLFGAGKAEIAENNNSVFKLWRERSFLFIQWRVQQVVNYMIRQERVVPGSPNGGKKIQDIFLDKLRTNGLKDKYDAVKAAGIRAKFDIIEAIKQKCKDDNTLGTFNTLYESLQGLTGLTYFNFVEFLKGKSKIVRSAIPPSIYVLGKSQEAYGKQISEVLSQVTAESVKSLATTIIEKSENNQDARDDLSYIQDFEVAALEFLGDNIEDVFGENKDNINEQITDINDESQRFADMEAAGGFEPFPPINVSSSAAAVAPKNLEDSVLIVAADPRGFGSAAADPSRFRSAAADPRGLGSAAADPRGLGSAASIYLSASKSNLASTALALSKIAEIAKRPALQAVAFPTLRENAFNLYSAASKAATDAASTASVLASSAGKGSKKSSTFGGSRRTKTRKLKKRRSN